LMTEFGAPDAFEARLAELLAFYADRTIRPSETGPPATLLPAFNLPKPVLRALETGLKVYIDFDQDASLRLADRLWQRDGFEFKYLAVGMLAAIRVGDPGASTDRLLRWMLETRDDELLARIFSASGQKDMDSTLETTEGLLESKDAWRQDAALVGMASLARYADESALPTLFRLYGQALEDGAGGRQALLLALSRAVAKRSPGETAYILRQTYLGVKRQDIARLLRQCLPLFPDTIRRGLLEMLKENPG